MQISLKQAEIINALKKYLSQQGINLNGKTVEVTFTAGRKGSGLSAEVYIDDDTPQVIKVPQPTPDYYVAPTTSTPVEETSTVVSEETKGTSLFA